MNLLGGLIAAVLATVVLFTSRTGAAVSIIAGVCYLTEGQQLEIAGIHFTAIRILLMVGLGRIVVRGETKPIRLNALNAVDWTLLLYAASVLTIASARVGTQRELVYRIGTTGDLLLSYFVLGTLLRNQHDVRNVISKSGLIVLPFALLMAIETATGRNPFGVFGGVYDESWVRDDQFRSAGAFRNAITAGSFGATIAMLCASTLFAFGRSPSVVLGVVCSLVIVLCAHSSGPVVGLALGAIAFGCWRFRAHTRKLQWAILVGTASLALVMKAPVWWVIARIADLVGGGGYHRALLIDRFVSSFGSWWLAGTSDTSDWFPYSLPDGRADITNRFVADGLDAGLLGLFLSLALVFCCFRRLGVSMRALRGKAPEAERMLWGLGATMVANVTILCSVTYFDQMSVVWCFLVACIGRTHFETDQAAIVLDRLPHQLTPNPYPLTHRRTSWHRGTYPRSRALRISTSLQPRGRGRRQ